MTKRLFTDIAAIYDRLNHVFSLGRDRRWRRLAAARVKEAPRRILDLATGTGDFAFALARRFPDAEILGLDLTPAMLEKAVEKNTSPKITFQEGDAMTLPLPSAPDFDLVACAFGFRNIPDKRRALAEARRVLKPGGRLLALEFFRPTSRLLGAFTMLWLRLFTLIFARSRRSAYNYLRESMKSTLTAQEFIALVQAEGFILESRAFFFPCCTCLVWKRD